MSGVFHKSCYTSRSAGYKYRTLSTNTGEKKHRDSHEDNTFDKKLKELNREMSSRIVREVTSMAEARDSIRDKFNKIDTKINSMLELQQTVIGLRSDLHSAEVALAGMMDKVYKIEVATAGSEPYSLQSRKSLQPSQPNIIFEEQEVFDSTITHI